MDINGVNKKKKMKDFKLGDVLKIQLCQTKETQLIYFSKKRIFPFPPHCCRKVSTFDVLFIEVAESGFIFCADFSLFPKVVMQKAVSCVFYPKL